MDAKQNTSKSRAWILCDGAHGIEFQITLACRYIHNYAKDEKTKELAEEILASQEPIQLFADEIESKEIATIMEETIRFEFLDGDLWIAPENEHFCETHGWGDCGC